MCKLKTRAKVIILLWTQKISRKSSERRPSRRLLQATVEKVTAERNCGGVNDRTRGVAASKSGEYIL
jgi:hypothetical protein